ncbi:hypothetical protein SESBI_28706 [Sesbania bispinosa]|nr:hypothetical protein SESBI_28706 [Sesbania bispinosa]
MASGVPSQPSAIMNIKLVDSMATKMDIKTIMNVDVLGPSRLRFRDDDALQRSIDEKLGVHLSLQHMDERGDDLDDSVDDRDDSEPCPRDKSDCDMLGDSSDLIL